jgi:recombination endonuclease VII
MTREALFPADKRCPDCGESKPLEAFPRNKNSNDGRHGYRKPRHNARGHETRQRLYGGGRHYHLKRRYGIGAADVPAMIEQQRGVCAICRQRRPEHVDHNHATGKVRGILCFGCNGGLGQFQDNTEWLARPIEYVTRHTPHTVQEPATSYILSVA